MFFNYFWDGHFLKINLKFPGPFCDLKHFFGTIQKCFLNKKP